MQGIFRRLFPLFLLMLLTGALAGNTTGSCEPEPLDPVDPGSVPAKPEVIVVNTLLATQWGQRDEYAVFAPYNKRLGCWSTALAQILYHHRLAPFGSVEYFSSKYDAVNYPDYHIQEDLESVDFDWDLFVPAIMNGTSQASQDQVAAYEYFTAVTIQKDFDTGSYVLSHTQRAAALEDHYDVDAKLYAETYSLAATQNRIIDELEAGRPLMMHLRDKAQDHYHAVAVDGYGWSNDSSVFWIHINMGHKGVEDDWYRFDGPVTATYNDASYRKIMTIKPL